MKDYDLGRNKKPRQKRGYVPETGIIRICITILISKFYNYFLCVTAQMRHKYLRLHKTGRKPRETVQLIESSPKLKNC